MDTVASTNAQNVQMISTPLVKCVRTQKHSYTPENHTIIHIRCAEQKTCIRKPRFYNATVK